MSSNAGERDVARRMGFGRKSPRLQLPRTEPAGSTAQSLAAILGMRSGTSAAFVGVRDPGVGPPDSYSAGRVSKSPPLRPVDVIVYQCDSTFGLRRIREFVPLVKHGGVLWVLWPHGQSHITEGHIRRTGLAAGMTDVALVGVSDRLSGMKLVHGRGER